MIQLRYCILGAGPSGLAFANRLKKAGVSSFVLLEKENHGGGLCRSAMVDGSPLDIGGGHFLDVRRQTVLDFLFEFMPRDEWNEFQRVSKIRLRGNEIDHPLEANLWQLPIADQIDFLESVARAGCVTGQAQPEHFDEWIHWKLGTLIADEYMLPYNRRRCGRCPLDHLGSYWLYKLPERLVPRDPAELPGTKQPGGTLPAHGTFLYSRKNTATARSGDEWREALGDQFVPRCPMTNVDVRSTGS